MSSTVNPQPTNSKRLGELRAGDAARILSVGVANECAPNGAPTGDGVVSRLLELGFLEGARVEVLHEAPFGKDPIAIRVRGGIIALRRNEANLIEVQPEAAHE
jgi:ferrous iron transport protein A